MNCTSCPSTVRVSQGGYNVKGETKRPPYAKGGGVGLTAHGSGLPAWWGRYPLGVPFERAKGTKTRLGRSPLRTSLGYEAGPASKLSSARHPCCGPCFCHHTRPPWAAGPMAGWFPRPGLPWRSGVPAAGSQASGSWEQRLTRVRPWQSKYNVPEKQARSVEFPCHLCDPTGPRAETRRTQGHPVPRGGFHKAGEGPAFGDSFPSFSSWRFTMQVQHLK